MIEGNYLKDKWDNLAARDLYVFSIAATSLACGLFLSLIVKKLSFVEGVFFTLSIIICTLLLFSYVSSFLASKCENCSLQLKQRVKERKPFLGFEAKCEKNLSCLYSKLRSSVTDFISLI